jgi:hypothetical protein
MKKIPTLFKRDFSNNGMIISEYNDGVEWVLAGEGVATRKYDGTSVLIRAGKMYKRYELRPGKVAPTDFEEVDHDETTGKKVGWVQVGWGAEDKWFREAIIGGNPDMVSAEQYPDGNYELVGPKVQGNPEHAHEHYLLDFMRKPQIYPDAPTGFDELKTWLSDKDIEGLVWHHPDGRMVKIKLKDYRLKRLAL